jgi:glycyl-tRNA synthetase alpha chain
LASQPLSFQKLILTLHHYWSDQGCVILQPYDMEMGAGTFHTATTLRALGPDPGRPPSSSPAAARPMAAMARIPIVSALLSISGDPEAVAGGPPVPLSGQPLRDRDRLPRHDIRFVEDDWESPTLGAWGLGWEGLVRRDGGDPVHLFPADGRLRLPPRLGELTYGLERLAMYVQNKDSVYDLDFNGKASPTATSSVRMSGR